MCYNNLVMCKKLKKLILVISISIVIILKPKVLVYAFDFDFKSYPKDVKEAYDSCLLPEVYNLPEPFKQESFHPTKNSVFGLKDNRVPIHCVDMTDKEDPNCMAVTFDSAYINRYTYKILDILDQYDFKATFFMTYEFMESNPDQILDILKRGHEIGNHSTTHPNLNKSKNAKVMQEVMRAHNYIVNLAGVDMCLFRFPYGSYSERTVSFLKKLGYYPIQWTVDSADWLNTGKEDIIRRITSYDGIKPGSIILFHNGAKYTPQALPEIFDMIKEKGLKCVKVSDLIYKDNFYIKDTIQYSKKEDE